MPNVNLIELWRREEQRLRAQADDLAQRAMAPRAPPQGRIVPQMGLGEVGAQLGEAWIARKQYEKADELARQRENAVRAQFGLPPIPGAAPRQTRRGRRLAAALRGEQFNEPPDEGELAEAYRAQHKPGALAAALEGRPFVGPPEPRPFVGPPEPERQPQMPIPPGMTPQAAFQLYLQNPELYWRLATQQQGGQLPAELQTFNAMTEGLSPEDQERARRIQLGLDSRAGQSRVVVVGGVPTLTGVGEDGQPFQIPLSSLQGEAGAAGTINEAQALGTGRGQNQAALERTVGERGMNAGNTLAMLDIAEPLLDVATGSGAGAARDAVAAFFGEATTGAQANAQLQVLQAGLMLNMPRMEGPQSDRDTELYRQAAAQIGNPNIPTPTRKAAVQTIRVIQQRYADRGRQPPTNVIRYDAQGNRLP